MSENVKLLYYALWIAHPVLQLAVATVMLWRGLHRQFKFFFAYIVTQILTFALIFPAYVHNNAAAYFYLYWATHAVGAFLGFMIIREVFLDIFRAFHTLRDLGMVLFKWAGLVMLLVAGVVSISTNSNQMPPWMQSIISAERCVRIVQVGLVLFLLFFARYVGVSRRQHSFGIALGFGSYAVVELGVIASWVGGHLGDLGIDFTNMIVYNAALLTWGAYFLAKSPARDSNTILLQPQRWEQSLSDIHHPLPADSLIPMFEGMVDRALSRSPAPSPQPLETEARSKAAAATSTGAALPLTGFSRARSKS
jgi:hypothetical protein